MQTNTTIIVEPTMEEAINDVIQMAKDDYFKWTGHGRAKTEVDNNMIKEFNEVIDSWRSDHIWKYENNEWTLKNPIWLED